MSAGGSKGWGSSGKAPLARCDPGTHLWCGLGRRVRRRRARERRSPLDGENPDELDAGAGRDRGARYEKAYGYGVAEHHRRRRVPVREGACQHPNGPVDAADRPGDPGPLRFAVSRPTLYDRSSMVVGATILASATKTLEVDSRMVLLDALSQVTGEKEIKIVTRLDADRSLLRAEVADTGRGIEPGDFRRLFEPYFSRRDSGTGLGLAIVQRTILEHGGQIRAERNHPNGARFIIELPMA